MTAPAPSGGTSPLRVGGLALLGIGAVAALVGVASLVTGNSSTSAAGPTSTAAVTATAGSAEPAIPTTAPGAAGEVPVPSFGATATNGIAAPPTTAPGSAAAAGGSGAGGSGAGSGTPAVVRAPVRVYNNSTITGLAARAAQDFRNAGWPVEQVANYPSGVIPTSTVYYRPGTGEQSSAQAMAGDFGMRAEPRFEGLNDASPGLIVIVTNDYQRR